MASDDSADETNFTDCAASGNEFLDTPDRRRRRVSVSEMVRRAETRQKRSAPDRGSKSPCDPALPAAKRAPAGPAGTAESPGVELSAGALAAIRQVVDAGIGSAIAVFEAKFEKVEKRLSLLEAELMDKDSEIRNLGQQLTHQLQVNAELQAQVESIDLNRRLSSLILTCDDFGTRRLNEDIEVKVVSVLNDRIAGLNLATSDIQVAHRLQRDDKVVVKFVKRSLRDKVYDARFSLASFKTATETETGDMPGSREGRRLASLFITESLTAYNQQLYNQLLQVRRSSGGERVASVFSRRGLVFCRTVRNGPNIRVPDEATLHRIIGGAGPGSSPSVSRGLLPAAAARPERSDRRYGAVVSAGRGVSESSRPAAPPPGGASQAPVAAERFSQSAVGEPSAVMRGRRRAAAPLPTTGRPGPSGIVSTAGLLPAAQARQTAAGAPPAVTAAPPAAAPAGPSTATSAAEPSTAAAAEPSAAAAELSAALAAAADFTPPSAEPPSATTSAPSAVSSGAPSVAVSEPPSDNAR